MQPSHRWPLPARSLDLLGVRCKFLSRIERNRCGGRLSGLTGNYYNTADLTGAVAMSRLDGPVDFDWGAGSPGTGVNADYFSVRWTGHVLVPTTGWYTFQTQSDDGVRLWVNGQQVISNWTLHGPTDDNSAPVYLKAGARYPIEMNMYEAGGERSLACAGSGR
ncbi:PA14 domain-containing protein [Ideonella paludis]|uniref:PA14 domain-containing protein n=1 Tax=Ideonella paludis TaxID=1233411 RepID=UPI00362809D9